MHKLYVVCQIIGFVLLVCLRDLLTVLSGNYQRHGAESDSCYLLVESVGSGL